MALNQFLADRWWGGREGGYDQTGEWVMSASPSWGYRSMVYPGLNVRIFRHRRSGRGGFILSLSYAINGTAWVFADRCDGRESGLRRAEAIFDRLLAEAWNSVWKHRHGFWRWDPAAKQWVHLFTSPSDGWSVIVDDASSESGVYAVDNARAKGGVWYFQHTRDCSYGGLPPEVPPHPSDRAQDPSDSA